MNKSFVLFDKNNNLRKNATAVVKFKFDDKDYLIYSIEENDQNSQIFVSKIILNSEGKYFVDDLLPDEKGKLNNIVYNIVILIPTEEKKGIDFESLVNTYLDKLSVKLFSDIPDMEIQEYYSNCSVAITNKVLVESAVKLYEEKLNKKIYNNVSELPTWTAPTEVTSPIPAVVGISETSVSVSNVQIPEPVVVPNLNLQSSPVQDSVVFANTSTVNPQVDKLVVVSDPSLGIGVQQSNVVKKEQAGFANNKYIIIGTVCLILAVVIVVTAYFLIKNMG